MGFFHRHFGMYMRTKFDTGSIADRSHIVWEDYKDGLKYCEVRMRNGRIYYPHFDYTRPVNRYWTDHVDYETLQRTGVPGEGRWFRRLDDILDALEEYDFEFCTAYLRTHGRYPEPDIYPMDVLNNE